MEGIGSGAVTAPFTEALNSDVIVVIGPTPPRTIRGRHILQAGGEAGRRLVVMDRAARP
jgi:formate dehydrogenase major subunit